MKFEIIGEDIKIEKEKNEMKKMPKYLIYEKDINFTICKMCKNAVCYLQPVLNKNSEPCVIYNCSKKINFDQYLFENNFLLEKRTCSINEYLNFLNNKNYFNINNKCYFHENETETLYCIQCQKFFCKKECLKIHNDLQEYHIFSEIEINLKNFCNQHTDKKNYKINCYCLNCKQFLCEKCKVKLCVDNESHFLLTLNELNKKIAKKMKNFINEQDNLIKKKEEEKEYLFKKFEDNSFADLNINSINNLKKIIINNLEANNLFKNICKAIFTTYEKFKYFSNPYILGNVIRFLNLNEKEYDKEKLNKDYLISFYKTNYLIEFRRLKIFKAIREINLEKIHHVITYKDDEEFIMNCEIDGESLIIFVNNEGKINQDYIKLNSKGKITAMITVKNLLVLGFTELKQKNSRLKVYNITDTSKIGKKKNQYSHSAHSNDILKICEIKDFQILTLSYEPFMKLWNIKDEILNTNLFYFPNNNIVNNIIKFNKRKIVLIGNDFISIYKFEKKVNYSILENKNINSFYLLDEKKYNIKKRSFLVVESDVNVVLYDTEKIEKPKKYITQKLSELNFESKILNICFLKSFFCCQFVDGNLSIINLVGNYILNRLFLYNFYSISLGKCFTFQTSNNIKKILFIKKNDKNDITGYIIFEEIFNNTILNKEIVIS